MALVHAYAAHVASAGASTEQDGWLGKFVARTADMSSVERAAALEDDEALAVSHNDMARQVKPDKIARRQSTFNDYLTHFYHNSYRNYGVRCRPRIVL